VFRGEATALARLSLIGCVGVGVGGGVVGGIGLGGCSINDPAYVPAPAVLEVDGPGSGAMAGAGGAGSFGTKGTVALRLRASTGDEEKARQAATTRLGYEVPQLREDRFHVEVRYTVSNLGDKDGKFFVHVDGANEFTRYDEEAVATAFTAANEDPQFFGLLEPVPQILGPGEIFQGIVREDDFHEAALDLDALGRFMAPFLAVILNRSEVDPIGLEMVPVNLIRPAFWELTVEFTATQHMTCQFLVRVRDDDHRLLWDDGAAEFVPNPTTFTPVIPPRT
jgi:hypothetical protein